jgi:hypothetical protein
MRKSMLAIGLIGIIVFSTVLFLLSYKPSSPVPTGGLYPWLFIYQDGSFEPSSTPIKRDGNLYTLTADTMLERVSIEKSNLTFDGNGNSLEIEGQTHKSGRSPGPFEISNVENLTVRNIVLVNAELTIENSSRYQFVNASLESVFINNSHQILVSQNNMSGVSILGEIQLTDSTNCTISSSLIKGPVSLKNSHLNSFLNNDMTTMKPLALRLEDSHNNLFFGNRIERTHKLFEITGTSGGNIFVGNYVQGAFSFNPTLDCSGINTFYHNNFMNVYWNQTSATPNKWDSGAEGNYWNTYEGADANGDALGDTPHPVDTNNQDRYPLMKPVDLGSDPQPQLPGLSSGGHYPLYEEITAIKDRLTITITERNFSNPVRTCDFYELREEDSGDYFQTTVNYWVFQHGQEEHGDIEAYVEIYNVPDRYDLFVVEVARNCWNELTVSLDDSVKVVFPTVTSNTLSLGYITFEVTPK